jgi:hypothetical protein
MGGSFGNVAVMESVGGRTPAKGLAGSERRGEVVIFRSQEFHPIFINRAKFAHAKSPRIFFSARNRKKIRNFRKRNLTG